MDETEGPLYQAWLAYVIAVINDVGITVTFANELSGQDAPRPTGTYLTLNIISGPGGFNGISELRKTPGSDPATFDVCTTEQYTISIQAFRAESRTLLEKIRRLLDSPIDTEVLKESKIAIVDKGTVTNIAAALSVGFERRHSLDVTFNSTASESTGLGSIGSASISGTIKDGKTGDHDVGPFLVSEL